MMTVVPLTQRTKTIEAGTKLLLSPGIAHYMVMKAPVL
jgi:hypothetical protein